MNRQQRRREERESSGIQMTYAEMLQAYYIINGAPPEVTGNGYRPGLMDRENIPIGALLVPLRRINRQLREHLEDYEAARKRAIDDARPAPAEGEEPLTDEQVIAEHPEVLDEIDKLLTEGTAEITVAPIPVVAFERHGFQIRGREIEALGPLVTDS